MDITRLLTRSVNVQLGGDSWPLLFTHRVLLEVESALGVSILNGEFDIVRLSAKALRATLSVALLHAGAEIAPEEIGRRLGFKGIAAARQALVEAWVAAMPEREPDEDAAKPKSAADSKKHSWLEVWANNRLYLRLTDNEWLEMTPRMCQALDRHRREDRRRWELQFSRLAATTANYGFCRPNKPIPDAHFMVDPWPEKPMEARPDSEEAWNRLWGNLKGDVKVERVN